jgi:hypothetical protein
MTVAELISALQDLARPDAKVVAPRCDYWRTVAPIKVEIELDLVTIRPITDQEEIEEQEMAEQIAWLEREDDGA